MCCEHVTVTARPSGHTSWCHTARHDLSVVSCRFTSRHITSHHITSHHITSHHITSHHITSHHITSHHITSHHMIHITSHHITSHHITSHHITSHHITSHHITSHHITSHITSHHITSHHITSHHMIHHINSSCNGHMTSPLPCSRRHFGGQVQPLRGVPGHRRQRRENCDFRAQQRVRRQQRTVRCASICPDPTTHSLMY
jgi:hypothetical protein